MGARDWVRKRLAESAPGPAEAVPHDDMEVRATKALERAISANQEAQEHAEEAARLFGAIRREIAVTKARGVKP